MAYSNGYNLTTVLPALFGRLAWSTGPDLNTANKTSKSGRYFDDGSFHAAVTVPNIKSFTPSQTGSWDPYFTAKQNAVISRCLNGVFSMPEFADNTKVYDPDESEIETLVSNTGKAVGYRIEVPQCFDKTVQLNSLELYFDGAATFNVYLFKQGSKTAVKTKEVTTAAHEKTRVDLTDWYLNYKDAGIWYVVYFQDDLGSVKAIQEQACFNEGLFFDADTIIAEVISGTDFNRKAPAEPILPQGLNIQVSSFRDFTSDILNQPHLFDNLLGLTMAAQVLEDIVYTVQSNATERKMLEQLQQIGIQLDLNGVALMSDGPPPVFGLKKRIDAEIKRVREAFYPCHRSQTIDYANCED